MLGLIKMEETFSVLFEPRKLQFATSQLGSRSSLLMAWWASSALGQGCGGTFTVSHPWGELSRGEVEKALAHPSQSVHRSYA